MASISKYGRAARNTGAIDTGERAHPALQNDPARGLHVARAKIKVTTAHKESPQVVGWNETGTTGTAMGRRDIRRRNYPGPPARPKSSGECWFTRCGRGRRAGRPWETPARWASVKLHRSSRRPTGCLSRQAGSPDVSEPWAHPRSTPRSFVGGHAMSRATGFPETRTRAGFRCFSLCPSLFGRATSKTRQLLRGCDMNAVYFVSPAWKATARP